METQEIINLIVAVALWAPVSVVVTQAIKRVGWPAWVKVALAIACAMVVGVAGTWVNGDLIGLTASWGAMTSTDVVAYVGIVYASATLWYRTYFGKLDLMRKLEEWPRRS